MGLAPERARETLTVTSGAICVHPSKGPRTCGTREFERIVMKQAMGGRLTREEHESLGYSDCRTPAGAPRCTCGHYDLVWPHLRAAGAPK